jgi:hypothetical protein
MAGNSRQCDAAADLRGIRSDETSRLLSRLNRLMTDRRQRSTRSRPLIRVALVLTLFALTPDLAHAVCTQQEAMQKADQLVGVLQAKGRADPQKAEALVGKMQAIAQSYQGKVESGGQVDWGQVCAQYDDMLKQAQ